VVLRGPVMRWMRRLVAALALGAFLGGGAVLGRDALDEPREAAPAPQLSTGGDSPRDLTRRDAVAGTGSELSTGGDSPRDTARKAVRPAVVRSRALGLPWRGRLAGGMQLPASGPDFFTWDPIRKRTPNRAWRRWGTDRLVATVLRVLHAFAAEHAGAPRIGVGDLSRPNGGDFGVRYGRPGHVSHQNGLDVDVYYPRRDGAELAAESPAEVDRALAQDLVDRFVRAGAVKVFVGPNTGLTGDPAIVQPLRHHDDHLHVRLPARAG
jgi:murein endopeptidase